MNDYGDQLCQPGKFMHYLAKEKCPQINFHLPGIACTYVKLRYIPGKGRSSAWDWPCIQVVHINYFGELQLIVMYYCSTIQ